MESGGASKIDVRSKWSNAEAGARYALNRWRDPRAALRDPMLVERILDRHGVRPAMRPVLDVPCGTGRLRGVIERRQMRYVGVDVSLPMLHEAQRLDASGWMQAEVERLPFQDDSFDVVVCCRLLHHLRTPDQIEAVVQELTRVSRRMVIASFWDSASLHALRRRVGLRRSEGPTGRRAVSKRMLRQVFDASGAEVVGFHYSFRFVSQQTFAVALKRAPVDERAKEARSIRSRLFDLDIDSAPGSLGKA
ncbi:MAG: class I SAM-dependent methyltransferase [Planctomycetes bacterium]|nr:class I SAM-dependent methyltransferase [Planctomycetota bacterium]